MKILTFNWHETYVHMLGRLGLSMDVVPRSKGGRDGWQHAFRPLPRNAALIDLDEALRRADAGAYDVTVCHAHQDMFDVLHVPSLPKVMLFHTLPTALFKPDGKPFDRDDIVSKTRRLLAEAGKALCVFVSERKQKAWGLPGRVILPGIDLDEYRGWKGEIARVLRVGQFLLEQDHVYGKGEAARVLEGLPVTYLGDNPKVPGARLSHDWDDLRLHYQLYRAYFHTPYRDRDDCYNLAALEAMATGMPLVSLSCPDTFIQNEVNGLVSEDEGMLRTGIERLLEDVTFGRRLGEDAREAIRERFPMSRFVEAWKEAVFEAADEWS